MPKDRSRIEPAPRRSIAQLNRSLRSIVEAETLEHFFWAAGKVDRLYKSDRGHIYFDLVDDDARIRCMLREEQSGSIALELQNHLDVEVYGDVRFYERNAEAQINALKIRAVDADTDTRSVVDRLRAEGLYPPKRKPAPKRIRRIGILTSRSSRAVGDFETAYQAAGERSVLAPLTWQYVQLEGERARQSIVDGIKLLGGNRELDVIAIIRGGGRYENLAVFDDFEILRAIALCPKYIVAGIGHQRDHCLADDLADYVAATPTAAATYLAQLCLDSPPRAQPAPVAAPVYAEAYPPEAYEPPPYDFDPRVDYAAPPPQENLASASRSQAATVASSRAYKIIVIALLLLAVAAVAFLGYAILQTA